MSVIHVSGDTAKLRMEFFSNTLLPFIKKCTLLRTVVPYFKICDWVCFLFVKNLRYKDIVSFLMQDLGRSRRVKKIFTEEHFKCFCLYMESILLLSDINFATLLDPPLYARNVENMKYSLMWEIIVLLLLLL